MLCTIYRSKRNPDTYLYVRQEEKLERVPEELLTRFGVPELAMHLNLDKRDRLARVDIHEVREALETDGYFLQVPPPRISMLDPGP